MQTSHIIRQQYLHVEVNGTEPEGVALQRNLSALCRNGLLTALEKMLDRIVPAREHWLLERLEIDAGCIRLEKFESELIEVVTREAERQLRLQALSAGLAGASESKPLLVSQAGAETTRHRQEDARGGKAGGSSQPIEEQLPLQELPANSTDLSGLMRRRTEAHSVHEAFIHFLETGSLPWWFQLPSGSSFEQAVQGSWEILHASGAESAYFRRGMAEVMRFAAVRKRLVQQFSADFLLALLHLLAPENAQGLRELLARLGNVAHVPEPLRLLCTELWQTALAEAAAGNRHTAATLVAACWSRMQDQQLPAAYIEILLAGIAPVNAQALHEVLARLEGANLDKALFSRFSGLLGEAAFTGSLAGKRLTSIALVTECWNALTPAERQDAGLSKQIKLHWPTVPQVVPRGNGRAEAKSLRDTKGPGADALADGMSKRPSEQMESLDLKEGIYLHCAGLVLLHPFLPRFFEALGIAREGRLLQPERAVCLLHYLATGQGIAPEYELQLPKLLCGVPFETPVPSMVELTAGETEEAAALLAAVIRHWDALRDTTADGLRSTFLLRPGRLSSRDDGDYLLQVEARSFDLLLDQLPWSIGIVQLPWMSKMLWVEWH